MRPLLALLLLGALAAAGCGADAGTEGLRGGTSSPGYRLADVENALEGAGLALVRDGPATIAPEVESRPYVSRHYAAQNGAEFEVLVFATPQRARRARVDIAQTDLVALGGAYTTAANAVAALPRAPGSRAYRVVWETFRRLAITAGGVEPGDVGLTPGEIAGHPDRYGGRTVAISGTLVRVLPAGAERPLALVVRGRGTRALLVVPEPRVELPPAARGPHRAGPSPKLRVVGVVTRMGRRGGPEVPHEFGVLRFRGGDPVVLASSVRVIRG